MNGFAINAFYFENSINLKICSRMKLFVLMLRYKTKKVYQEKGGVGGALLPNLMTSLQPHPRRVSVPVLVRDGRQLLPNLGSLAGMKCRDNLQVNIPNMLHVVNLLEKNYSYINFFCIGDLIILFHLTLIYLKFKTTTTLL